MPVFLVRGRIADINGRFANEDSKISLSSDTVFKITCPPYDTFH